MRLAPMRNLSPRARPLSAHAPRPTPGCRPGDGGALSVLSVQGVAALIATDASLAYFVRPIMGVRELMHADTRYCLWLTDAPDEVLQSPALAALLRSVQDFRLGLGTARATRASEIPWLFVTTKQPSQRFVALGRFPALRHGYLALAAHEPDIVVTDSVLVAEAPSLDVFSILSSRVFAVWHRAVSPGVGARHRVSVPMTYNNFPYPEIGPDERDRLETASDHILTARQSVPHNSLADLYDSAEMPEQLRRAHQNNDRLVLSVFGLPPDATDEEILAVLFERYEDLSAVA